MQADVNVRPPSGRTVIETLEFGNKPYVSEPDFSSVTLPGDIKSDVRTLPFSLVLGKTERGLQNVPNDFFARNQLCCLLLTEMEVFVAIRKLITDFVGTTLYFS